MRRDSFQWQAVSRGEPGAAWSAVCDAVSEAGGCVLDARSFSNKAFVATIELPAARQPRLIEALRSRGVEPSGAAEPLGAEGTLRVDLIHDAPDSRDDIPAVPG